MIPERASIQQPTSSSPADALRGHRFHLRAGILFASVLAAGVVLAAGIAPRLEGFDRWVILSMGAALVAAATAFLMLATFLLETREPGMPVPPQPATRHRS